MKSLIGLLLASALAGLPVIALAASPAAAPAASSTASKDDAKSQEDLEKELEQARQQLQDAAHRVADLSMRINGPALRELFRGDGAAYPGFRNRAVLGVDVRSSGASAGVPVQAVTPGGPAERAGLKAGDVITSINGTEFKASDNASTAEKLVDFMDGVKPGESLKLAYTRDGKASTTTVTAGSLREMRDEMFAAMPVPPVPPVAPIPPIPPMRGIPGFSFFLGGGSLGDMQLVSLSSGLGQYFGTDKGLLVVRAPQDSKWQLKDGDVILAIGGRDPGTPPHAMRILGSYGAGETVKLDIMRKGKPQSLSISLPKAKDDSMDDAFNMTAPDTDEGNDDDNSADGR